MNRNILNNNKKEKGYTLLFAVLVSSLVLAIGISILNVSKKEFLLATSARDSSEAFYAADSGLECAVYNDVATSNWANLYLDCSFTNSGVMKTIDDTDKSVYTFHASLKDTYNSACTVVDVTKYKAAGAVPNTGIVAKGYNLGWDKNNKKCDVPGVKKVERALYYSY